MFFCLVLLLLSGLSKAAPDEGKAFQTLTVPARAFRNDSSYDYFVGVLELALQKGSSADNAEFVLTPDPLKANQDRLLRQVQDGVTDITWSMTSAKREQSLLPVYFPVAKGLFGYRVFLIHAKNQQTFKSKSVTDLKKSSAVQGRGWPDVEILRFNGYWVEDVPLRQTFRLVESQLADYFPRSVMEVENEMQRLSSTHLVIESSKGFYYPSPVYFFVHKDNIQLAKRIKAGLDIALSDGSLLTLFNQQTFARTAELMLRNRAIITLKNPLLSAESSRSLHQYEHFLSKH